MSLISTSRTDEIEGRLFQQFLRGQWFSSLPISLSRALFESGRLAEYRPGQSLFTEGGPSQGLFGVIQGAVHFETIDHCGRRVLFHVAGPGYWCGGISVGSHSPMPMSARAFARTRVLHIPAFKVSAILAHSPEGYRVFCALIERRLSTLVNSVAGMRRPTAIAQVATRLIALDLSAKENDHSIRKAVLHMTQSDLADMTGHSRQTINAIVARFQENGFIEVSRRQIVIVDAQALEKYCFASLDA
jgi:CRP/FNR family transcriptional regulator, cyclic AMP receptor protein